MQLLPNESCLTPGMGGGVWLQKMVDSGGHFNMVSLIEVMYEVIYFSLLWFYSSVFVLSHWARKLDR